MKYYKRILFPTDFSKCADVAYEYALLIANIYNAELHIFHAYVTSWPANDPESEIPYLSQEKYLYTNMLKGNIEKNLAKYRRQDYNFIKTYKTGYAAAPTIVEYIKTNKVDLVIMGTHGRRGLRHMMLGSVAEELLRTTDCPVITIRKDDSIQTVPKRILVPTDYSTHARDAVVEGHNIAKKFGADLILLHVIEEPIPPAFYLAANDVVINDLFDSAEKDSKKALSDLVHDVGIKQKSKLEVIKGHIVSTITEYASDNDVDLIVMGSHGYTGLTHFLLGSTTEKVLRSVSCPVMTVKSPK
jgi:nucleotide-binding universal stress UspA family protein